MESTVWFLVAVAAAPPSRLVMSYQTTVPSRSSTPQSREDLGELHGLHDPEGFDVVEVVEHEAGDGEHFEVFEAGVAGEVAEFGAFGDEGEGDDGLETGAVFCSSRRARRCLMRSSRVSTWP